MTVQPIPEGFRTVTPHLIVDGAKKAVEFYKSAFGAEEVRVHAVDGTDKLMHAHLEIGDSAVMLADAFPEWGAVGPDPDRNSPVVIHLYFEDVDAAFKRAVDAGAEVTMPPQDMFWGDRYATVNDPFGHRWSLGTRIENPTPEELVERGKQAFQA